MAFNTNWLWMLVSPTHAGLRETRDREAAANNAEDLMLQQQGVNDGIFRDLQIANDQLLQERRQAQIRQYQDIGIKVGGGLLLLAGVYIAINKLKQ